MRNTTSMRFVLAFAATGNGHYYAAEALANKIRQANPSAHVEMLDVFGERGSFAKHLVEHSWLAVSTNPVLRPIYRFLYGRVLASRSMTTAIRWLGSLLSRRISQLPLSDIDHYIALHPAAVPLGVMLKRSIGCRFSVVATDHILHNLHCHDSVDQYFVPYNCFTVGSRPEEAIRSQRVWHREIPIADRFYNCIRASRKSKNECFRVLVSFGATGLRGMQNLALIRHLIDNACHSLHLTLVAGKNVDLQETFLTLRDRSIHKDQIAVYGLVQDMANLMMASHLLVGKPGGLTVTEARHLGLPVAIVDTLPGQEDFNCNAVVIENAGIRVQNGADLINFINELRDPVEWVRWSQPNFNQVESVVAVRPNSSPKLIRYGRLCNPRRAA